MCHPVRYHKEQATDVMLLCAEAADELAAEIPMQMRSPPKIIDHTQCITEADRATEQSRAEQTPFPFSIHSTICFLAGRVVAANLGDWTDDEGRVSRHENLDVPIVKLPTRWPIPV